LRLANRLRLATGPGIAAQRIIHAIPHRLRCKRSSEPGSSRNPMTKMIARYFVYGLLLSLSAGVAATDKEMSAGEFEQMCLDTTAEITNACQFFILGIWPGISLAINIADGKARGGRPCFPSDISNSALATAIRLNLRRLLAAFPDERKLDAAGIVGAVIVKTFPCAQ
jgi:hypothetical protein